MKAPRQTQRQVAAPDRASFGGRFAGSWETQWQHHRQALRRCRHHPVAENLHQLRVATRRLLAHLDLLRTTALRPARWELKRLLRATAAARDAQIQARLLDRLVRDRRHPGLKRFRRRLKKRAWRLARELAKELKSHPPKLRQIRPGRLCPPPQAATAARRALRQAFNRLQTQLRNARTGDADVRHRARIALKKFRYMAEVGPPARPGSGVPQFKRLHAVQSALGQLHDFDLFLHRLEKFAARHKRTEAWLRPRRAALNRRRTALLRIRLQLPARVTDLLPAPPPAG